MFVCNVFAMSLQCLCNGCVRWVAHTLYIGAAAAAADPVLHEARTRDPADATLPDPHLSGLWQGRHRPRHHGRAAPGQCGRGGCRGRGGFVWAGWGVFARSFCLNRNPTLSLSLRAALDTNHTNRTYHTNRGGGGGGGTGCVGCRSLWAFARSSDSIWTSCHVARPPTRARVGSQVRG